MNTWALLIVLTSFNGGVATSQLGPYDSEAQCRKIKDVVDHALQLGSFSSLKNEGAAALRGKTLVCTLGRNV